jgi:hypothetical protein
MSDDNTIRPEESKKPKQADVLSDADLQDVHGGSTSSHSAGGGGGTGKVSISSISITKETDVAST